MTDLIVKDNSVIKCELWLKSEDRPTIYKITKKELLQTFVNDMNDLHGSDWYCFETFFDDTGKYAYGTFYNDKRLREKGLTYYNIVQARRRLNREKWANEKLQEVELFYLLSFKDVAIKIGRTYGSIENRLYNYIFPSGLYESFYKDKTIDFRNSYLLTTDVTRLQIRDKERGSFEKDIKNRFQNYRHKESRNSREILAIEAREPIVNQLNEACCINKKWKLTTLFDYTGFQDSNEMKEYNRSKGTIATPIHFFRKGSFPELYLKKELNDEHTSVVTEEMWSRLMNNHEEEIKIFMTKNKDLSGNDYWGCPLITDSGDEADMFYGTSKIGYLSFDIENDNLIVRDHPKKTALS